MTEKHNVKNRHTKTLCENLNISSKNWITYINTVKAIFIEREHVEKNK